MLKKILILLLLCLLSASCAKQQAATAVRNSSPALPSSLPQVDLLITHGLLVTMDGSERIISDGWMAVKNGVILNLGTGQSPYASAQTIDASGQAVLPGLVNTHAHSAMVLFRGSDDSSPYASWLLHMQQLESRLSADDVYWGSLLAEAEMIASGTTSFNDMYFFPEQTAKAAAQAGMRAVLRVPITQTPRGLAFADQFTQNYPAGSSSLIDFSLAPNPWSIYSLSELKEISQYAAKRHLLVHIHFEEDSAARAGAVAEYGLTPVQVLAETGLINNSLLLAHGVDVTASEISQLARHPNIAVSFNPKSEAKLSGQVTPAPQMLDAGLTVAFGTDGAASSNSLDLFGQINFAAYGFLKCQSPQAFCDNSYTADPKIIFAMATKYGALALGLRDKIGSLEIGKRADIITVDISQPETVPHPDIYSTLVYNTTGHSVNNSIIDGKVVMKNRQLLTINLAEVSQKVDAIRNAIISQAGMDK